MARTQFRYLNQYTVNSPGGVFGIRHTQEIEINMILNLYDLRDYADALAKRVPRIAHRVLIDEPGISADNILHLSALRLPPIYASCIQRFNLFGVAIGYFSLWPGSIKAGNMINALIHANQENHPAVQQARRSGLVLVAQEEANLVCVGQSDSNHPDRVYMLDVMRSSATERQSVAQDFEKFLLLAGNLHEIGHRYSDNAEEGMVKMVECCVHFGCVEEQMAFWMSRAKVILS
jgi:hypothetical protein